jgi:phosphotransferase system enzyme I (PtsI)
MRSVSGISINPGLFIGNACHVKSAQLSIRQNHIPRSSIDTEISRLHSAISQVETDIQRYLLAHPGREQDNEIIRSHLLILKDPEILPRLETSIRSELHDAAWAVQSSFDDIIRQFSMIANEFFAQRASDYRDVAQRLLTALVGDSTDALADFPQGAVAILNEVTPSLVIRMARHGIKAYVSQYGSLTTHASILSRSLNIIALTGISNLMDLIQEGHLLIVDAYSSLLIVDPDPATLDQYRQIQAKYADEHEQIKHSASQPATTLSGRHIFLQCNIGLPSEAEDGNLEASDGIGLFRTEFLYLGRNKLPDEAEQAATYSRVAQLLAPRYVTIRTFDLGGDKLSHLIPTVPEENPNLGCRGIRFSLLHNDLFKTQLRAILRASSGGNLKVMFPMVADTSDLEKALRVLQECREELDSQGIPYDKDLQAGVMIEVPSAAICAAELAREAAFFSIGTNDLIQYTLAADRNNDSLADYYLPHHPAVLELIRATVRAAKTASISVSVCGEMASALEYIPLLIGLGVDALSVNPNRLEACKAVVRRCDADLEELLSSFSFSSLDATQQLVFENLRAYYRP